MRWRWALVLFAVSGIAFGQDDLSPGTPGADKPKPSVPVKPVRKEDSQNPAKPSAPPSPAQDTQSVCETLGGEWLDGQWDMQRQWCFDANNRWDKVWDKAKRQCLGKVECGTGYDEVSGLCVKNAIEPLSNEERKAQEAKGGRTWGSVVLWTGIGLGVVGAGTGAWVLADCEDKSCPSHVKKDWDTTRAVSNISTGSFVVGSVLLGLGIIGLSGGDGEGSEGFEVGVSGRGIEVGQRWVL